MEIVVGGTLPYVETIFEVGALTVCCKAPAESGIIPPVTSRFSPRQIYATAPLSLRQTKILWLLGAGKTTREIAAELKISVKTVQDFYEKLKRKLRAGNIHQLFRIA